MNEMKVSISELKSRLSEYLRRVKAGETLIITKHGRPIARIVPEPKTLREKMLLLVDAGLAEWNGERPEITEPVVLNDSDILVSDLVVEMRDPSINQ
jgi:prevent-host-death family protein